MGERRRWWSVVGVALLVVVLVRGEGAPATAARRGAPADPSVSASVFFIGDSIMRSAVGPLQQVLVDRNAGLATVFSTSGGLGVDDSPYVAARLNAAIPATGGFDAVVVNLGANDVLDGYVTPNPASHMRRILDAAGSTPVLWLNQAETLVRRAAAAAYNDDLVATAADYPNLVIVEWGPRLDQHPDYLQADGLHLNGQGQAAIANEMKMALDEELGS